VELPAFCLYKFAVYLGNGFGVRMDRERGIQDFYHAWTSARQLDITDADMLFHEVDKVLRSMMITPEICEECLSYSFIELDDFIDCSDMVPESRRSNSDEKWTLYSVFDYFSGKKDFDERWWQMEREANQKIVDWLKVHRKSLSFRKR
jgi:hypothetical protein